MSGSLKEVRQRIRSVQNTQQITKAMKMVSAAKLRRAQAAIQQMRPYAEKQQQMLRNVLSNLGDDATEVTVFSKARPVERACLVVVTSSRGLCGAFNTNIHKALQARIESEYRALYEAGRLTLLPIGKKGYEYFAKRYPKLDIITDYVELFGALNFDSATEVANRLMEAFEQGRFDKVEVAYGHFKNAVSQYPTIEQWLPVPPLEAEAGAQTRADYIFEPDMKQLLQVLVPGILRTSFYKFLLDTHASEHGARMTAMDNATENANELLRELRISYNKARQEAITKEILEIVGGAAALEAG